MTGAEEVVTTVCSHDFSALSLFAQASWVVKFIIIILLGCSFWSWSIIFAKTAFISKLKKRADKFEDAFWNCGSLDIFFDNINTNGDDPFIAVFSVGMKEWRNAKSRVKSAIGNISLEDRVRRVMDVTINREMDYLESHIGFLATVGSTAPFVGLLGMVWGIMTSFEAISVSQQANLASVAPGIAEALFTTALGLIVTIPAVIAYNKLSTEINRYRGRLEAFTDEFSAIVSRQMESTED